MDKVKFKVSSGFGIIKEDIVVGIESLRDAHDIQAEKLKDFEFSEVDWYIKKD